MRAAVRRGAFKSGLGAAFVLTALASTVGDAVKRAAFSVQRGAALVGSACPRRA
jgi:hypothetical protein